MEILVGSCLILHDHVRSLNRFGLILQDHEIIAKHFNIYHDLENCLHTLLKIY